MRQPCVGKIRIDETPLLRRSNPPLRPSYDRQLQAADASASTNEAPQTLAVYHTAAPQEGPAGQAGFEPHALWVSCSPR